MIYNGLDQLLKLFERMCLLCLAYLDNSSREPSYIEHLDLDYLFLEHHYNREGGRDDRKPWIPYDVISFPYLHAE